MKIGFTGTRLGMSQLQLNGFRSLLKEHLVEEFHHGDCVGSDCQAHEVVRNHSKLTWIVIHSPTNNKNRAFMRGDEMRAPLDYLVRNKQIVMETEVLFVTPDSTERRSSGTWATVRFARKLKKPIVIIFPDGSRKTE